MQLVCQRQRLENLVKKGIASFVKRKRKLLHRKKVVTQKKGGERSKGQKTIKGKNWKA